MLIFYRTEDCLGCKGIQTALEEMRLAHKVIIVKNVPITDGEVASGMRPPVLVDEKEIIQGKDNILKHLEKLEEFKEQWYKFQSDACYCDEEGNII